MGMHKSLKPMKFYALVYRVSRDKLLKIFLKDLLSSFKSHRIGICLTHVVTDIKKIHLKHGSLSSLSRLGT